MTADWIDRDSYPFAARYCQVQAGRMHYVDEGKGRHAVVMVHGNPTWSYTFRHLIKALSDRYRCVAVDHIGFGLSDKPTDWGYRPEQHAENLGRVIDALDVDSVTLVVEDWGGPIGLSWALANPEKIEGIVLMNTWMWPVNGDLHYEGFSRFMGGWFGRLLIRHFNFFARVVLKQAFGDKSKLTPAIHQHYLMPLGAPEERTGCAVFPREILGSSAWLKDLWEQREVLASIPTLVLWGMQDIAFREKELETWKTALPAAEFHPLAGVGHCVLEEYETEANALIRSFLDRIQLSRVISLVEEDFGAGAGLDALLAIAPR